MADWRKFAFWVLAVFTFSPLLPLGRQAVGLVVPLALILGTVLALAGGNPYAALSKRGSKWLLQGSVVLLGFSMDISKVIQEGKEGLVFALISISAVFGLGWLLRRSLHIRPVTGLLVSAGTAICGGSAIAAVSTVVEAPDEDVSVAVGTVLLLNAIGLLLFPPLGHLLGLSQRQFGVWSGIAIHDVASVVGAGASYGREALDVATAVKLSRVLYLVPVTFAASWVHNRSVRAQGQAKTRPQFPWFVGLFLLASLVRGAVPAVALHAPEISRLATAGFSLSLFILGTALSRATLRAVGVRPLLLGAALWIFISVFALIAVLI